MIVIRSSRKYFLLEDENIETFVDIVDKIYGEDIHIKYMYKTIEDNECLLWYPISSVIRISKIENFFLKKHTDIEFFNSLIEYENKDNQN